MKPSAKQAHRNLAMFIGVFLVIHLATHLSALIGIEAQEATLHWGRKLYQFPLFELALILALAVQITLGIILLKRIAKRKIKGWWHWLQFSSGCILAFFIVNHTVATVGTRLGLGLDTNFYWAAGTLILAPIKYVFAPYYFLAVTALFTHIIAALHFRKPADWHAPALVIGPLIGGLIIMGYSGLLYPVDLPQIYKDYFDIFPGVEQN